MSIQLPTLAEAKRQAQNLRADHAAQGRDLSHAQALERVAHLHGFRDWNALHAAIRDRAPAGWSPGGRVEGRYLKQAFTATVLSAEMLQPGWYRLVLDLDEAVDVVRFDSFSNFRRRITAVVGPDGHSKERLSDGTAHVELTM